MKTGKAKIVVNGLNRVRLIGTLGKEGVTLYNVENLPEKPLKFIIKATDMQKTFAILKKLCYNYSVEWDYSVKGTFLALVRRAGLATGFALGIAFCVFACGTVYSPRVFGLNQSDSLEVVSAVKEETRFPTRKNSLDLGKIKSAVMKNESVAECNVSVKGGYLVIDVLPAVAREERKSDELVSTDDAIITRVVATGGTALVSPGDVVKKGARLISGEIFSSTGDAVIKTVVPTGEVYGKVVLRDTALLPDVTTVKSYTGRTHSVSFLLLNAFSPCSGSPYAESDVFTERTQMDAILPLNYTRITYAETTTRIIPSDVESTANAMLEALRLSAHGGIELDARVSFTETCGMTRISVYLTVEKKISS